MNILDLQQRLRACLGERFEVRDIGAADSGRWQLLTPYKLPDGDLCPLYVQPLPDGERLRISDAGLTLMRLSWDGGSEGGCNGAQGALLRERLQAECGLCETQGELFLDSAADALAHNVTRFAQAIMRLHARDALLQR